MQTFLQDLRHGLRMMRARPAFALVAVGALAIGIAANTIVFAIADAVLLHGLPFRDPERLVMVWQQDLAHDRDRITVAPGEFLHYRRTMRTFSDMAAALPTTYTLTAGGAAATLEAARVSPSLFATLGVQPALGRAFTGAEALSGQDRVALLGYNLWQREFAGKSSVLGSTVRLESGAGFGESASRPAPAEPYTVVGVLPPDFRIFYTSVDIVTPLVLDEAHPVFETRGLRVIARLKSGAGLRQAQEEIGRIDSELARAHPVLNRGVTMELIPLRDEDVGDVEPTILILLAGVVLVLLIVCANVANMLLARAAEREREMGVRVALGASPGRLVRQLLTEALLLGLFGAGLGVLLALWGLQVVLKAAPESLPRVARVGLDARALGVTLAAAIAAGLIAGLAPALRASRGALAEALSRRTGDPGRGSARLRRVLVAAEVAVACIVLIGTSLLWKSFRLLEGVELGFEPRHALTLRISPPRSRYAEPERRQALYRAVLDRVRALPGVAAAGATNILPLIDRDSSSAFELEGQPAGRPEDRPQAKLRSASSGYFAALGIRLLAGRDFTDAEASGGAAIVTRSFVETFARGGDPFARRLRLLQAGQDLGWVPIVGVVDDVRQFLDTPPRPTIYYANLRGPTLMLAIRAAGDPERLSASVRAAVRETDPELPVYDVLTMQRRVAKAGQLTNGRFRATLGEGFGSVSLVLAALGVFGVMHYSVLQRTREIGIRMALGARPRDILRMVLRQGFVVVGAGLAVGLGGSLALTPLLARFLYGIKPTEPRAMAAVVLGLAAAALAGALLPARRAARVDPAIALSRE